MPGVVEDYVKADRRKAFENGRLETRDDLKQKLAHTWIANDFAIVEGREKPWSVAEYRSEVQRLAHSENAWIQRARETGVGKYQDDDYRRGAREGVMEFSRGENHRLLKAEREAQRESVQERESTGYRVRM